jgi:hypothetical protein
MDKAKGLELPAVGYYAIDRSEVAGMFDQRAAFEQYAWEDEPIPAKKVDDLTDIEFRALVTKSLQNPSKQYVSQEGDVLE